MSLLESHFFGTLPWPDCKNCWLKEKRYTNVEGKLEGPERYDDADVPQVEYVDETDAGLVTGVRDAMLLLDYGEVPRSYHAPVKRTCEAFLLGKKVRLLNVSDHRQAYRSYLEAKSLFLKKGTTAEKRRKLARSSCRSCLMCGFASNFSTGSVFQMSSR